MCSFSPHQAEFEVAVEAGIVGLQGNGAFEDTASASRGLAFASRRQRRHENCDG